MEDILARRTSFQINAWSSLSKEMTIKEVLLDIQSDKHRYQVLSLRKLLIEDKKGEYTTHKRTLSAVTFCGTFDGERKKPKIKEYNSIIVLDIDSLDEEELKRTKTCLLREPIVFSFWESPSKTGLKGLVSLSYCFELARENIDRAHKGAFQKLAVYFKEKHNIELDNSGSDTTRLCFLSYDPSIVIKTGIVQFEVTESDLMPVIEPKGRVATRELEFINNKDALYNPANRNKPSDRYTIGSIIRFLENKKLSITYTYAEWYKVAMAIASTFTHEVGEKYFLKLSSFDKTKYDEVNCKNFLVSCYQSMTGEVTFRTIVYFANKKGYITKKQKDKGTEAVDENLSQISSSNTVVHLPEDLKR